RGEDQPATPARDPSPALRATPAAVPEGEPVRHESRLGVTDRGIFADLDDKVQLALPAKLEPDHVSARLDRDGKLLVLSIDGFPRKAYPLGGETVLKVGRFELSLRAGDRDELRPLLAEARIVEGAAARD